MRKKTYAELYDERPTLQELAVLPRTPIIGILENIRSMQNIGAAFRTADALRLSALYLSGYSATPPRDEIDKTALGSTESVPWRHFADGPSAVKAARKEGFQILVAEQAIDAVNVFQVVISEPVAVVFGNEVWGVSEEVVAMADRIVEIPMLGLKQSLNVSVSFGVALYGMINANPFLQVRPFNRKS
jgi:tRNA G18 (ribose-2'-O)-methylase SpoU